MASGGILTEYAWISAVILLYSALCLLGSALLGCMLWQYGERQTYVALITIFVNLSTLASIAQQVYYAADWIDIKQSQYDRVVAGRNNQPLPPGGVGQMINQALFWIQYYSYNTEALLILFWAVALFKATWNPEIPWISRRKTLVERFSKAFAIIFPAIFIGLVHIKAIVRVQWLLFVLVNFNMCVSLTAGSVLIILILYKYVKTRRIAAGSLTRSPWWASASSSSIRQQPSESINLNSTSTGEELQHPQNSTSIYDRALIVRFTIGFVVLAAFDVTIIVFDITSSANSSRILNLTAPDYSIQGVVSDLATYIPGVTASLFVFLVFGTTKSFSQYRTALFLLCCTSSGRRRPDSVLHGVSANPRHGMRRSTTDTILGLVEAAREPSSRDWSVAEDPEALRGPRSVISERSPSVRNFSRPMQDPIKSPSSSSGETLSSQRSGWDGGWRATGLGREEDEMELRPPVIRGGSRIYDGESVLGKQPAEPELPDRKRLAAGTTKTQRWFGVPSPEGKRDKKLGS